MYCSYQLYTRNTGLSYCIFGMDNLIGYVQVPVKYEVFWKIIFIKSEFLNFIVVLLPCGCLSLNPFIEISIRNNSSSSDVLSIQASISISPKFESK